MTKKRIPEIHRMMVLNACHISKATNQKLFTDLIKFAGEDIAIDPYEYGWHVVIMDKVKNGRYLTTSLKACVKHARKHKCTHLRIDQDGPIASGLQIFNW